MSDFAIGDIVSLSQAQTSTIDVLTTPVGPEAYTVTLPINDTPVPFTFDAVGGETVAQVLAGLEQVLLDEQTLFSVAIDGVQLFVVGPLGFQFTVGVTSNLQTQVAENAVRVDDFEGRQRGELRVVAAKSTLEKLREFSTRLGPGQPILDRNLLLVRELGSANVFEVFANEVLTVVERAP